MTCGPLPSHRTCRSPTVSMCRPTAVSEGEHSRQARRSRTLTPAMFIRGVPPRAALRRPRASTYISVAAIETEAGWVAFDSAAGLGGVIQTTSTGLTPCTLYLQHRHTHARASAAALGSPRIVRATSLRPGCECCPGEPRMHLSASCFERRSRNPAAPLTQRWPSRLRHPTCCRR